MTPQELKNSILQLAIQGKLVEQRPEEGTAEELYQQIQAEKQRLIKAGAIKQEKMLPEITEDEKPFDIPESWKWVRLGDCSSYAQRKEKVSACNITENMWSLDLEDIEKHTGRIINRHWANERGIVGDKVQFYRGQILYSKLRPYLKKVLVAPDDGICSCEMVPFAAYGGICAQYLVYALIAPHVDYIINSVTYGVKMPRVGTETMVNLLIPLPPLAEQKRIVAKIEELLPYINRYEKAWSKLEDFNKRFPGAMQKSILQQAIQGKLVEQDPADEPANVLLQRIRAEKEQLIKEGKVKKDKHESVIFRRDNSYYEKVDGVEWCIDDKIPFDIPESWSWTRMGALVQVNPRNMLVDDLDVGFMPMPLLMDGFQNTHTFEVRKWKEVKSGFTHLQNRDVVIAKITPCFQNRKSAVLKNLPNGYGAGTTELHVLRDPTQLVYMPYILWLCKTHDFIEQGMKVFSGTAGQQRVGKTFVADYLVPLPPIEEQKRIVRQIEELLSLCKTL